MQKGEGFPCRPQTTELRTLHSIHDSLSGSSSPGPSSNPRMFDGCEIPAFMGGPGDRYRVDVENDRKEEGTRVTRLSCLGSPEQSRPMDERGRRRDE